MGDLTWDLQLLRLLLTALSRSPSVCQRVGLAGLITDLCPTDTVDQIINRVNDAGEFDELELVWMLSA